jgi:hypothetical protein
MEMKEKVGYMLNAYILLTNLTALSSFSNITEL